MNKYCVIVILFNFNLVNQSSSLLQRNLKGNLFHKINVDMQNTINKIFELLKLNKNFTSLRKHRLLLSMHATMKSIAENNYLLYRDAQKASKLSVKTEIKDVLFNLDKLVNILDQEKLTPGNTTMFSDYNIKTGINLQLTSLEVLKNEEETFASLKEYLKNLDDSYNIDSPLRRIQNEFEKNSQRVKRKRKLKAWKTNHTNLRRVFHGKIAQVKKFPFLASIHILGEFVCAGSIINKLMVITAATCLQRVFYENNKEIITIRVGSDHTNKSGILCDISQIFFHPYYNPETLSNNLAILKIGKELKFEHKTKIRRVDYQRMEGNLHSSIKDIIIVGWGDLNHEYLNDIQLSYSHLDVYNLQRCIQTYTSKYVNEKHFCAGFTSVGDGACQRDIGAPGIAGDVLAGVVSFGPPVCGTIDAPTVFTNLGYYIDWIDSVVKMMPFHLTTQSLEVQPSLKRSYDLGYDRYTTKKKTTEYATLEKKYTTPIMKTTTSQYPKAIKVLTYLLNELIAADQNEDNKANNDKVKNLLRTDQISNSTSIKQTDILKDKEELYSFLNQKPENNNNPALAHNNPLFMAVKNIGSYLGFDNILKISKVFKTVPEVETEYFEDPNIDQTEYKNNIQMEPAMPYAPVLATSQIMASFLQHNSAPVKKNNKSSHKNLKHIKAIQRIGIAESKIRKHSTIEEEKNAPGVIFENMDDDTDTNLDKPKNKNKVDLTVETAEFEITTQAVIYENTNDPEDLISDMSEGLINSNISDNYETENSDEMSTEISPELNLSSYKFRTTKCNIGPKYKKDHRNSEKISIEKKHYVKKQSIKSIFLKTTRSMELELFKKPIITDEESNHVEETTHVSIPTNSWLKDRDADNLKQRNQKLKGRNYKSKNSVEESDETDSEEYSHRPTTPEIISNSVTNRHKYSKRVMSTMLNNYNPEFGESDLENGRRFLLYNVT